MACVSTNQERRSRERERGGCTDPHAAVVGVGAVAAHLGLQQLRLHGGAHAHALAQLGRRRDAHGHGTHRTLAHAQNGVQRVAAQVARVRLLVARHGLRPKQIKLCELKSLEDARQPKHHLEADRVVLDEQVLQRPVARRRLEQFEGRRRRQRRRQRLERPARRQFVQRVEVAVAALRDQVRRYKLAYRPCSKN